MTDSESELVVDLRGRPIGTPGDFWDAVSGPLGLPEWFGRNLDAWSDTLYGGGVSAVVDRHPLLVVHVDRRGLFAGGRPAGEALAEVFDGKRARLLAHPPE
ncbi:barstar family protein [Streptomyces sp. NPDC047097]|uniref:barstar family protein n=1 Tax=Streptomyces sp. NPDC047097 TaxID=3155260 RepID=UPI0033CCE06B